MDLCKTKRGVGLVAVVIIMAVLSVIGAAVSLLVATGAVSKTDELARDQAFGLIHGGFEYAFKRIDDGADPNGNTRNLGAGSFTVTYTPGSLVTIASTVSAMQGNASQNFSVTAPSGGNASCLVVNTAGAFWENSNRRIAGMTVQNTCAIPITINGMTVGWNNALPSQKTTRIRINNGNEYNRPAAQAATSCTAATPFTSRIIPATTTYTLTIEFNTARNGKLFTIIFYMTDGTTKRVQKQM